MNRQLQAFVVAVVASHQRRTRWNDKLVAVALDEEPHVTEECSCGFALQRPALLKAGTPGDRAAFRRHQENVRAVALAIEAQWRDHLVEVVAGAVATWLEERLPVARPDLDTAMRAAAEAIRG